MVTGLVWISTLLCHKTVQQPNGDLYLSPVHILPSYMVASSMLSTIDAQLCCELLQKGPPTWLGPPCQGTFPPRNKRLPWHICSQPGLCGLLANCTIGFPCNMASCINHSGRLIYGLLFAYACPPSQPSAFRWKLFSHLTVIRYTAIKCRKMDRRVWSSFKPFPLVIVVQKNSYSKITAHLVIIIRYKVVQIMELGGHPTDHFLVCMDFCPW